MLTKAIFRADSSLALGTGHVVRCLTLATALARAGVECTFAFREQLPPLEDTIRSRGFRAVRLKSSEPNRSSDARQTRAVMEEHTPDLLVVDHYSLDRSWESAVRTPSSMVMAIDDLADRPHDCDILLDQNLGRNVADYAALVPARCLVLAGPENALLRPEFGLRRAAGLRLRAMLAHVLLAFGGADADDATGRVLECLRGCALPIGCRISVVMGSAMPHLQRVAGLAEAMPWPTRVLVDVKDMAQVMADCDLAVGAAGGTAWERCCLGLPALLVVQAENQRAGSAALHAAGAAQVLGGTADIAEELPRAIDRLVGEPGWLSEMSAAAARIVDGRGTERVLAMLEARHG